MAESQQNNDVFAQLYADLYISSDEDSDDNCPGRALRPWQIGAKRKVSDSSFKYNCEWTACSYIADNLNEYNDHVTLHRRDYTRCLGPDEEIASEQFAFYCQWQGCGATIEGQIDDFTRHVFYHTFHQYLKYLGQHIQTVENLNQCTRDTVTCNIIPELPEKLICRWRDCGIVYDNPYIFYAHANHHCVDYSKGNIPSLVARCKWEGCTAFCKSNHKLRDHIRSHTQAKVVACPTCGSLFASNTRFIDHLIRQEPDAKFECSHCHKRFTSERILREHMNHHIHNYKCPECDMTCNSPAAVRDHVRYRHSQDADFRCPECRYRGKSAGDVRRHSRTHFRNDMFSCCKPGCDMVFSERTELFRHYKTDHKVYSSQLSDHEVVKEYVCHVCNKQFTRGTYLTTHLRNVHRYRLPSGHIRFIYTLGEDGLKRLDTSRYENIEVSQQILGQDMEGESFRAMTTYNAAVADNGTDSDSSTNSGNSPATAIEID